MAVSTIGACSYSIVSVVLSERAGKEGVVKPKTGVSLLHVATNSFQNGSSFLQSDQNHENTPDPTTEDTCVDNEDFIGANGAPCKGWMQGDCLNVEFWTAPNPFYVFTEEEIEDIQINCPASCFLCEPPHGHVRPILEDRPWEDVLLGPRPWEDPNVVLLGGDPFDSEKYAAGLAAGGVDAFDLSDRVFYPEIYYEGAYHPICGIDFNNEAAARACQDIERFTETTPPWAMRALGGASIVWYLKERFTYGGRVVKTNKILEQDAMPVGACRKGESLDSCTAGGNAFGNFTGLDGRCMKGNPVGVQIVCHRQCRKFGQRVFTKEHQETQAQLGYTPPVGWTWPEAEQFTSLEVCSRFLKNTTAYYFEDELLKVEYLPELGQFESLLNVMSQECAANVVELICHSIFKECKEVEVDGPLNSGPASVLLPSLLCKEECERHKAMWDQCVAKIQKDPADKELFNSNMADMSRIMSDLHFEMTGAELPQGPDGTRSPFALLDCDAKAGMASDEIPDEDVAASWILGRIPQTDFQYVNFYTQEFPYAWGVVGWAFPRFMSSEMLYPEISSTYTGPDGISHEVPCTIPGQADVFETTCPDLFVKSILLETNRGCVYACPVNQFTLDEYTTMWSVFVTIGMCSFLLNVFMVYTWKLGGRRGFEALPFQLKACVFLGLLYGVVETIPSLILKFDLPCAHETVEEVGSSWFCYVNRSSQYILLGIMVNLCTLTISIHGALVNATGYEGNMVLNILTTAFPFLFMVIAYFLDTDEEANDNYDLNVARHAFSCSMRFSTMLEEWLVLWLPFCVSGVLTAFFCISSWLKVGYIQRTLSSSVGPGAPQVKSEGQKKLEGQRRRLIRIAAMVSACLLLNVGTALYVTSQQSAWTEYEDKKLDCLIKTEATRNWKDYGFNDKDVVQDICDVPEGQPCSEASNSCFGLSGELCELPLPPPIPPSCIWDPARSTSHLVCSFEKIFEQVPDDRIISGMTIKDYEAWLIGLGDETGTSVCDCSCSDLLPDAVERPSTFVMTLSFAAQSMVAAIVALNLGFREDNLALWKKALKTTVKSGRTIQVSAATDSFQFDSQAYERDDPSSNTESRQPEGT